MKFQKLEAINSIPCHLIPNMWTQKIDVWRTPKCDGTLKCNGTTTSDSLPKTPMFWLAKGRWSACIRIFCSTHVYIFVLAVPRCKDLPLLSLLIFTTRLFPPSCWFWICSSDVTNDVALTWRNIHIQTASDFGVAGNRTLELTIGLWHWPSGFGVLHIYTEIRVHL